MSRNARVLLWTLALGVAWILLCWEAATILRERGPKPMTAGYLETTQAVGGWVGFLGVAAINFLTLRWANKGESGRAGE